MRILKLIVSIAVCELAGAVGSVFTISAIPTWYATLSKPSFNPPNWVFGPAWTILYLLMGVSLYLIWEKGFTKESKVAVSIFGVQLALNALWSVVFFGLRSPAYALIVIIALWLAIAVTIIKFYKISRNAAFVLIPYLAWVSFAAILNYFVWQMNTWGKFPPPRFEPGMNVVFYKLCSSLFPCHNLRYYLPGGYRCRIAPVKERVGFHDIETDDVFYRFYSRQQAFYRHAIGLRRPHTGSGPRL